MGTVAAVDGQQRRSSVGKTLDSRNEVRASSSSPGSADKYKAQLCPERPEPNYTQKSGAPLCIEFLLDQGAG